MARTGRPRLSQGGAVIREDPAAAFRGPCAHREAGKVTSWHVPGTAVGCWAWEWGSDLGVHPGDDLTGLPGSWVAAEVQAAAWARQAGPGTAGFRRQKVGVLGLKLSTAQVKCLLQGQPGAARTTAHIRGTLPFLCSCGVAVLQSQRRPDSWMPTQESQPGAQAWHPPPTQLTTRPRHHLGPCEVP